MWMVSFKCILHFFHWIIFLFWKTSAENIFEYNIDRNQIYNIFVSRKRRIFCIYEDLWNECSKDANRTASVIWSVFQLLQEWRKWRSHINFVYSTDYHILDQNVLTLLNRKQRFLFIYLSSYVSDTKTKRMCNAQHLNKHVLFWLIKPFALDKKTLLKCPEAVLSWIIITITTSEEMFSLFFCISP